jgi:hypothetical protein
MQLHSRSVPVVKVELTVWIGQMGERKGERGAEPCKPPGSALEGYVACTNAVNP